MNVVVVFVLVAGAAGQSLVNVAIDGAASATSFGWGGVAYRAIDGNTDGKYSG